MKFKLLLLSFLLSATLGWGQASLPLTRTAWDVTPTGWTDTPLDNYLTTFACSGSNGAKFDTTGDLKIVNFNASPNQLTFVVKSNAATTSSLLVEESADGVAYATVVNLSGSADLPTTCTTKGPYTLNAASRFVRWKFTKGTSNMTMDDVSITASAGCTAAAITGQPSTTVQNLCQSAAATALSVTATGTTLSYQWYSNAANSNVGGTLIAGATSASYTPSTAATGTLYYYCVVTGTCGNVTSAVSGAVNVTALPANPAGSISAVQNCGNTSLTYSAPSASLYWQTSATGTDQTFATTAPYSATSNGTYYVRAFNGTCWSSGTVSQAVTVVNAVAISLQPANQSATVGNTATFTVTATNASSYQWQVSTNGGSTWTNVGTNSNSYTTPATTLAMSGYQYQVVVTGNAPCGTVTSSVAALTVSVGPCHTENFSNIGTSGTYGTKTWTGEGGTWTATDAREDQTITGKAITIRTGVLTSPTFTDGVDAITMTTRLPFADTGGNLTVKVNGATVGTIPYSTTTTTTTISGINVSGTVVITVENTNTQRVAIDDLNWTCYTPVGPEINVTGNGITIVDGDTTPTFGDNTNFGTTTLSTNNVKTFTIQNLGTTDLTLSLPITLTDVSAPQEFVITQPAVATIPSGGSTHLR